MYDVGLRGVKQVAVLDDVVCSDCREEHEFCTCSLCSGFFGEVSVNGEPYLMARVRFAKPAGFRQLFNPFSRVEDSSGRRFFVKSLHDTARIISAVKKGEPVDVLCRPTAAGFDVVRLGLDWLD